MNRRPVLAPGLQILRSSSAELQIGVSPEHRLRVPDTPAVRRALAILCRGEATRLDTETRKAVAALAPVLRDGDALVHPGVPAAEVAAVALRHPHDARARLTARGRTRVTVLGSLGADVSTLLTSSGLGTAPGEEDPDGSVVLLLSLGEPDRAISDRLVRQRTPHLVVRALEAELVVGPFVEPDRTACLRCIDAHRATERPGPAPWTPTEFDATRRDGTAQPVSAALAAMALGRAVADLVRYAEGDRPATWSATITFSWAGDRTEPIDWLRHPRCGCGWNSTTTRAPDAQEGSVTMGA